MLHAPFVVTLPHESQDLIVSSVCRVFAALSTQFPCRISEVWSNLISGVSWGFKASICCSVPCEVARCCLWSRHWYGASTQLRDKAKQIKVWLIEMRWLWCMLQFCRFISVDWYIWSYWPWPCHRHTKSWDSPGNFNWSRQTKTNRHWSVEFMVEVSVFCRLC